MTLICICQPWHPWNRLQHHPDPVFAHYILEGLQSGFRIGITPGVQFQSAKSNMQSAREHPQIIDDYLCKECAAGRILGPFTPHSVQGIHVHMNRFGVIPKKSQPGKWRLITDLSFPEGHSVNDATSTEACTLQYISVDQVALAALQLGQGALLAKTDIRAAYRLVPIHPLDRPWLGMKWQDAIYVDAMLPFGLRSAPKLFNAVADALEWCIYKRGVNFVRHYLDDFVVIGPPGSSLCQEYLCALEEECEYLGVPLATEKREGPSPVIILLTLCRGSFVLPRTSCSALCSQCLSGSHATSAPAESSNHSLGPYSTPARS